MDLTQIRYFLALAQTRNFTRAAELCNVTQPALTKSIQRLESELGGPLLLRERNHTQLTELGTTMAPMLRQISEQADMARQRAQQFHQDSHAQLRLGLTPEVEPAVVVPLLRQVLQRFPGVALTLRDADPGVLNDALLASEVDVILTADVERLTERANRWPLFTDPFVVVLPEGSDLTGSDPLPVGELGGRDLVGMAGDIGRQVEATYGLDDVICHRGASDRHVHVLVQAGAGIGLSTARRRAWRGLETRCLHPSHALEVFVAAMAGRPMSRVADAFLRLARARAWDVD